MTPVMATLPLASALVLPITTGFEAITMSTISFALNPVKKAVNDSPGAKSLSLMMLVTAVKEFRSEPSCGESVRTRGETAEAGPLPTVEVATTVNV
jgi:hypothetical protein